MFGVDVQHLTVKVNEGALLADREPGWRLVQQAYEQQMTVFSSFGASAVRAAQCSDLSGRRRIRADPPVQGNPGAAAPRARTDPRPDPRQRRHGLGAVGGRQGAGAISAGAGGGLRDRAQRRCAKKPRPGSRTTLDVLNAQQALVNARVALVTAQHDRVVASYGVLNAVGRLSPIVLNLQTTTYDPSVHYQQVRDSWVGVRHTGRPLISAPSAVLRDDIVTGA